MEETPDPKKSLQVGLELTLRQVAEEPTHIMHLPVGGPYPIIVIGIDMDDYDEGKYDSAITIFGRATEAARRALAEALGCPVLNLVSTRDRIVPAAAAPDVGTRVDIDAGHPVRCDRGRLQQLVSNLLANALKFGDGKPVTIERPRASGVSWKVRAACFSFCSGAHRAACACDVSCTGSGSCADGSTCPKVACETEGGCSSTDGAGGTCDTCG